MTSLNGQLLIASPTLQDPNFARAVILLVRHTADDGALGVVLNRPLPVSVADAVGPDVEAAARVESPLHLGGPCEGPLLAVHGRKGRPADDFESDSGDEDENDTDGEVAPGVRVTTHRGLIEHLMRTPDADPPGRPTRYVAGYAGWGVGQLEGEIAEGAWLLHPATAADVFAAAPPPEDSADGSRADPYRRDVWHRLTARLSLGRWIDPDRIPDDPSAN